MFLPDIVNMQVLLYIQYTIVYNLYTVNMNSINVIGIENMSMYININNTNVNQTYSLQQNFVHPSHSVKWLNIVQTQIYRWTLS